MSRPHAPLATGLVGIAVLGVFGVEARTGAQAPAKQNSFHEVSQRGNTRIFYWGPKGAEPSGGSIGQLVIDYGRPPWKATYDQAVAKKRDYRWRFGQNFWTNLDTNIDLEIADVAVARGRYYLALEHTSDDEWILWAIEPEEAYEKHLDAFHAHFTTGGLRIPLEYEKGEASVDPLSVMLRRRPTERDRATLEIRYGAHFLSADVVMKPAEG